MQTPLHYAARSPFPESAQLLMETGADVGALDRQPDRRLCTSPLPVRVLSWSNLSSRGGAMLRLTDKYGETPLHIAAGFGSVGLH